MLKITDKQISMLTNLQSNFTKGIAYYKSGYVQNVKYNKLINVYKAEVYGSDAYDVLVRFDKNKIVSFSCSCSNLHKYHWACKHVVALLKWIQEHQNKKEYNDELLKMIKNDVLSTKFYNSISNHKVPLKIEISLECRNNYHDNSVESQHLKFKIGINKKYILKNITEFIQATEDMNIIHYGKDFTYDPNIHQIPDDFKLFYALLKDIYYLYKESYQQNQYFNQKYFNIPKGYEKKVFETLEHNTIKFENGFDLEKNVIITKEKLPILVQVLNNNEQISMNLNQLKDIRPLNNQNNIVLYQNKIHLLDEELSYFLTPLITAIQNDIYTLDFNELEQNNLITKYIPQMENYLSLSSKVKDKYVKAPLKASIYLDKEKNRLIAKPLFNYDEFSFNPFSNQEILIKNDKYIARDEQTEDKIIRLIEAGEFIVQPNYLYIDDEVLIYDFVINILPLLQEVADIYYSNEFKSLIKNRTLSSSIRLSDKLDFLEVTFEYEDIDSTELLDIFKSYKRKKKYHRLKDGSFLLLNDQKTKETLDIIEYLDLDKKISDGNVKLNISHAPYLKKQFNKANTNQAFDEFIDKLSNPINQKFKVPNSLKSILRDYQVTGFKWLKTLAHYNLGGVLADEMGLGKTLQTIAFILDQKNTVNEPNLIVAPTSLVYNWESEIVHFAKELKYLIISGNAKERKEKISKINEYDIVVTSYPLIRKDEEAYSKFTFSHMFIDEAQYIKNPSSLNAKIIKSINAKCKFALTGTPMENSLTELWSIFDYILPGFLSNHNRFRNHFEVPIVKDKDQNKLETLTKLINPFILRRLKKDVLTDLPDKIERKVQVELSSSQQKLYLSYLQQTKSELAKEIKENGMQNSQLQVLTALLRLRQICCHPSMFLDNYHGKSAKLEMLLKIINESIEVGHKLLIFSQFTTMLQLLIERLNKNKVKHLYLDGSISMEKRAMLVKEFNQGNYDCFLISLKAGGTGLNLTAADIVIHVDPWWNPAVENQATDRAHRFGQTKTVQVMKLIAKGTIEDKIYKLQNTKKELIENVIKPGETFLNALNKDELYQLFDNDDEEK